MANFIHQLQDRIRELEAEVSAYQEGLAGLKGYLHSPKFSCGDRIDGYVSVADVLLRLSETRSAVLHAGTDQANDNYRARLRDEIEAIPHGDSRIVRGVSVFRLNDKLFTLWGQHYDSMPLARAIDRLIDAA